MTKPVKSDGRPRQPRTLAAACIAGQSIILIYLWHTRWTTGPEFVARSSSARFARKPGLIRGVFHKRYWITSDPVGDPSTLRLRTATRRRWWSGAFPWDTPPFRHEWRHSRL